MSLVFRSLERLTSVAPLGVRFWDAVTGRVVTDGLRVTAYRERTLGAAVPEAPPPRRVAARANRSGCFVFHHLPGLRDIESGAGDDAYWANLPPGLRFVLEVTDDEQRFLPLCFATEAPARDLANLICTPAISPLAPQPPGIPLFSAVTRPVPAAMAVLRAELWDAAAGEPAAWALVEARAGAAPASLGLADGDGRLALIFPYPEPTQLGVISSPAGPGRRPLAQQVWPIDVAVYHTSVARPQDVPDLCDVYAQLTTAPLSTWVTVSPPTLLGQVSLEFARDLRVSTVGFHCLLVTPAGTTPVVLPPME